MPETHYTARPALAQPRRFFGDAADDLKRAGPIGWSLFCSNLRVRYRRAWLGYLWLLLPALSTAALCSFIQSHRLVAIAPTILPYPVFVLAGMILWQTFVEGLNAPLQQLAAGRQMVTRSRIPHEALFLAGLLELALNLAVRLAVLAVMLAVFHVGVGPSALLIPIGAALIAILGAAIGLLIAPVGMLYEDINRGLALATGLWLFVTPVLYPLPWRGVLKLNPVSPLLDTTRSWLISGGAGGAFLVAAGLALALLLVAWLFYRLARPHMIGRLG